MGKPTSVHVLEAGAPVYCPRKWPGKHPGSSVYPRPGDGHQAASIMHANEESELKWLQDNMLYKSRNLHIFNILYTLNTLLFAASTREFDLHLLDISS